MAVYVDPMFECAPNDNWPYNKACHLMADTEEELHLFANRLGLKRSWFQGLDKASHKHYDLTTNKRRQAVILGAVEVDHGFAPNMRAEGGE